MIISSIIRLISPQDDGRKYIIEQHTTDSGREVLVQYLCESNYDYESKMIERIPELEAQLATEQQESE